MLTTLVLTIIILVICTILLCVKVILKKNGRFPNTHVSGNKYLRKMGIHCARSQDKEAIKHKNLYDRLNEINKQQI